MKRGLFFVFGFLVLVCGIFVSATDIGYVVRDGVEANVVAGIEEMGYSYEVVDDSEILSTDWDEFEMILVWDSLLADAESLPIGEKKSLVANTYYVEDWGIADYIGSQVSSGYASAKVVADNMISDGLIYLDTFRVYDKTNVVLYHLPHKFKRASGFASVISTDNYNQYPIVGMINAGEKLYSGGFADERIAFFGATESDFWTSDSMNVFKNTLHWVLTGEDGDDDGVFYDEDCDDSDAGVWRILPGYIDSDGDGFGFGNLTGSCSGDFLGDGYSEIDGDCDDSDASYNFDSDDVFKNCVNDAPIVDEIVELSFNESDVVVIDLGVVDPEGDNLTYEIDDERFVEENGVFRWESDNNDRGFYVFFVTVSDGEFDVRVRVEVRIYNQIPVWSEIGDVEWDEDTNFSLNLSSYVFDGDGDDLIFSVDSTSEDRNIYVYIEDGVADFSVEENWNGEDWIVFEVWDGGNVVTSNNVTLRVLAVNDAPERFPREIKNLTWDEGGSLENEINLKNYFYDVDFPIGDKDGSNGASDKLEFGVEGNDFIVVDINQDSGFVSFSSEDDWFGNESVVFSATDGVEVVYSNVVELSVVDVNEVPEFDDFDCAPLDIENQTGQEIYEDVEYRCDLNATDFENDSLEYSVVDEKNMNCDVDEGELVYFSKRDYFGTGSCVVRVSDDFGYSDSLIEFEVLPVNDAPEIVGYFPEKNVKLMEYSDKIFSVDVFDVDGDSVDVLWSLNSSNNSVSGDEFLFNREKGVYSLDVVVSDAEFSENMSWDIFVGDISDFSCDEVGGFSFDEDEVCFGDLLGVSDGSCCLIAPSERPPEFSDAKTCSSDGLNLSSDLDVNIRYPREDDDFEIGESVDVEVRVKNDLDDDLDFDVDVYFYDITDEKSVDDADDDLKIDAGKTESLDFEFDVENDVDDENDYAVFVRVVDEDGVYCGEDFVKVNVDRKEDDVGFNSFDVVGDDFVCGDYFSVEARIKNFGSSNQDDVVFSVGNSELGVFSESDEFDLEKFGGDDDVKKVFDFRIPEDAVAGEYEIEGVVSYDGGDVSESVVLSLGKCRELNVERSVVGPVDLNGVFSESAVEKDGNFGIVILIGSLVLLLVVLIGFLVL